MSPDEQGGLVVVSEAIAFAWRYLTPTTETLERTSRNATFRLCTHEALISAESTAASSVGGRLTDHSSRQLEERLNFKLR